LRRVWLGRSWCGRRWRLWWWFRRRGFGRIDPVVRAMPRHPSTKAVVVPAHPVPTATTPGIDRWRIWSHGRGCYVPVGWPRLDGHIHAGRQAEDQRRGQRAGHNKRSHPRLPIFAASRTLKATNHTILGPWRDTVSLLECDHPGRRHRQTIQPATHRVIRDLRKRVLAQACGELLPYAG
jgi:hypothetical protein